MSLFGMDEFKKGDYLLIPTEPEIKKD